MSNQFQLNLKLAESLMEAKSKLLSYRQSDQDTNAVHIKNVKGLFEVVEYYGGEAMFEDEVLVEGLMKEDIENNLTTKSDDEYKQMVRDSSLALHVFRTSKHKGVIKYLRERHMYREDLYISKGPPRSL